MASEARRGAWAPMPWMPPHVPHEPSDACNGQHCHWHNVDEDDTGAYIACFECGHVYRTKRALRRAYRREYSRWWTWDLPWLRGNGFGTRRAILRRWLFTPRASKIFFCQECSHDF